jgi:hypothetical protein
MFIERGMDISFVPLLVRDQCGAALSQLCPDIGHDLSGGVLSDAARATPSSMSRPNRRGGILRAIKLRYSVYVSCANSRYCPDIGPSA